LGDAISFGDVKPIFRLRNFPDITDKTLPTAVVQRDEVDFVGNVGQVERLPVFDRPGNIQRQKPIVRRGRTFLTPATDQAEDE
jgi:hypothetical protein